MSATNELRWWIIGNASAHEAQYATVAQRPPDRRPDRPCVWGELPSAPRHGLRMLCPGSHPKGPTLFSTCPRHAPEHTRATIQEAMFELCGWPGDPHFAIAVATHTASHAHEGLPSCCHASGPTWWTSGGGMPLLFHTLVLPWWRRILATRHRHSVSVS